MPSSRDSTTWKACTEPGTAIAPPAAVPKLGPSFTPVRARHRYIPVVAVSRDPNHPRIAADLAVLDECATDVRLQIDLHFLATIRALDEEMIGHAGAGQTGNERWNN